MRTVPQLYLTPRLSLQIMTLLEHALMQTLTGTTKYFASLFKQSAPPLAT